MYIEVVSHKLIYHMDSGTFTASGSLADLEGKLKDGGFFRCNNCYLVNANYIASVASHTVTLLDGTKLQISHPRKKQFMIALGSWLGEGNI